MHERSTTRCAGCAKRPSSAQRGYDAEWRRLVAEVLERDGYRCQIRRPGVCLGEATSGDHIVALVLGGARLDPSNVRAACVPCNSSLGAAARERAKKSPFARSRG